MNESLLEAVLATIVAREGGEVTLTVEELFLVEGKTLKINDTEDGFVISVSEEEE